MSKLTTFIKNKTKDIFKKKVVLYYFNIVDTSYEDLLAKLDNLTEKDFKMLNEISNEGLRKEKAVSQYFKHRFVGNYKLSKEGKPISNRLSFNISHSHEVVVIAMCKLADIGVDVEIIRPFKESMRKYISNAKEYEYIKDDISFLEVWTSKESLSKAHGFGITRDVRTIPALPVNGQKEYLSNKYTSHTYHIDNTIVSITIRTRREFETEIHKL